MGRLTIIGDPSCTELDAGKVVCGARSPQHTFVSNVFNGTTWGGWKVSSGTTVVTSNPSCAGDGSGKGALRCTGSHQRSVRHGF